MGRVPQGSDVVIIGDTPADMTCGQGIDARAIGVATGRHAVIELLAAGGHVAFDAPPCRVAWHTPTQSVLHAIFS